MYADDISTRRDIGNGGQQGMTTSIMSMSQNLRPVAQKKRIQIKVEKRSSVMASESYEPIAALLPEASDEELISAICLEAEWALERLYQRYCRYAYALAYSIIHESGSAEDIVQEVFLSIWCKAESYQRQQGSVYCWLQAIVLHRAIDRIRSVAYRNQQWTPLEAEEVLDIPGPQSEMWEAAWHKEKRAIIQNIMAHLPLAQRTVIELTYFEGYTHAEIALQLNIPLGTMKGRLRLGLQKMRILLQEQELDSAW